MEVISIATLTMLIMALIIIVIAVLVFLRQHSQKTEDSAQTAMLLQGQLDKLRNDMEQSLNNTQSTLLLQLNNVTSQLQVNTGQVDSRLDSAQKVIQDVHNKLGELGKATQEIKELGQSVSKLEEMLKAPKLRGGLGELLLEDLLKQVLPANAYDIQYTFKNGQTVDAIINTAGGKVPVDSKFPLENFRKMLDAKAEHDRKTAARLFRSDVKKHIDSIAEKYILPDEGTFDFALMYIPAENIYYETIIKDEAFDNEEGLYSYATKKRVVPVSPNSFYAHLRVIALGLKGLQIERSAREIFQNLERLGSELQKFNELFETLGAQLNNAKNNYDKADKQLAGLTEKFKTVQSVPEVKSPNQLNAFTK
jgi:DNA recombination protein RmuC